MIYVLICLCLSLAGIAGLQFFYMIYLEQIGKSHKKRIRELESHCLKIARRLQEAEALIAEQERLIGPEQHENEDEEVWADVIEDY